MHCFWPKSSSLGVGALLGYWIALFVLALIMKPLLLPCWCTVQFFLGDNVVGGFFIIAIMDFPEIAVQSVRCTPSADIIWPTS
jgi:hypothetical protein